MTVNRCQDRGLHDAPTGSVRPMPVGRVVLAAAVLLSSLTVLAPLGVAAADEGTAELAVRLQTGADVDSVAATHGAVDRHPLVASHGLWALSYPHVEARDDALDELEDDPRARWAEVHASGELPVASHRTWAWLGDEPPSVSHRTWAWLGEGEGAFAPASRWRAQPAAVTLGLDVAHDAALGTGVTVAVLDTGVDVDHPVLTGHIEEGGWDLIADVAVPRDAEPGAGRAAGHGTHVAGLVHLVAPEASLLPFRVLDAEGVGSLGATILAIELAVEAGADVVNLSFGTPAESQLLEDVIAEAEAEGVVFVAAAGNRGDDVEEYPARLNDVVAVAAVDDDDVAAPFTSDGDWIDLAAPGVGLVGPYPSEGWAAWSGTSMAAPLLAGQAALLRSLEPQRSAEDIVDVIDESVVEVKRTGSAVGEGRIDVAASLRASRAD